MSFLSDLLRRLRPASTAKSSPPSLQPSSDRPTIPSAEPSQSRLRVVERSDRRLSNQRHQPESEGALARSDPAQEEPVRRRKRRRRGGQRRGPDVPAGNEPLLFPMPSMPGRFSDMPEIERAVAEAGWKEPTPIQERAMPILRNGADLVGQAQTGSGKTGAFGIPIIEMLDPALGAVQALIVLPTRELAEQVTGEMERLGRYRRLRPVAVYGGVGIERQIQAIRQGAQIVVGTPGRILDHLQRGTLSLKAVRIVVLDEADRMLDMGFQPDVERILRQTPQDRRTALFSATIPPDIHELIFRYLRDPEWIRVEAPQPTVDTVEQVYYEVAERDKFGGLRELLDVNNWPMVLVFRRTQRGVDKLESLLYRYRYSVAAIHGGMSQAERQKALNRFASGQVRILVATNVAARGLDIPDISHVINYDMPEDFETYIHRVGRTARIGKRGTAVTFVSEADLEMFDQLRDRLKEQLRGERLALYG